MRHSSLAFAVLLLQACSNQQVYEAVQQNRQLECQRYPDTRYGECMSQSDTSYAEYRDGLEAADSDGR